MNANQEAWWLQALSDLTIFQLLRQKGVRPCHSLHYLQMVSEKIAKAYFWRAGPPEMSHLAFVRFIRFLGQVRQENRQRVATIFGYKTFRDFQFRTNLFLPIAYELEHLSPATANDGPNTEYPWPHGNPEYVPAEFEFPIWSKLNSSAGRDLVRVIEVAVERFPEYSDT